MWEEKVADRSFFLKLFKGKIKWKRNKNADWVHAVIQKNEFYSHINVSTYKSHSFFIILIKQFNQYLASTVDFLRTPFLNLQFHVASCSSIVLHKLPRKIVTLQFDSAYSSSPIVKQVDHFVYLRKKMCKNISLFSTLVRSDPFLFPN